MRQSLQPSGGGWALKDAELPLGQRLLAVSGAGTPSSLYPFAPNNFRPTVIDEAFTTAVLTKDNSAPTRQDRVFAVHAGIDPTTNLWAVQWYVIDPKFIDDSVTPPVDLFEDSLLLSDDWQPEIVAMGRITQWDPEDELGHCYHPVIGVTRTGQLYIEYTFSSSTVDQRIVRARIDNTYTAVADYELVQAGTSADYGELDDRWAFYGDMQADPDLCRFWSTHTLVEDADEREVWLFKKPYNCFTTDLNADGFTDTFDMAAYNDLYITGSRRADTDADGVIDVTDMATFVDAYDAATTP